MFFTIQDITRIDVQVNKESHPLKVNPDDLLLLDKISFYQPG